MKAAELLANFDRLSEAPGAVPRLRRFILDLAVRGKLVAQDVGDEPAAILLRRIRGEKARLDKAGKRKRVAEETADEFEAPFVLPMQWVWARLGDVAQYGISDKAEANAVLPENTWVLDLEDIEKDTSRLLAHVELSARPFSSTKTVFKQGDVLFGKLRPYLNKVVIADRDGVCTTEIIPIRGYCGLVPEYTQLVLRSPLTMARVDRLMYGMKMPRLGTADATALTYPLPPLAEQHRIVAKFDELKALCDQLEAAQQERERRRDRLAAASLQRLNQPLVATSPETQREHARFHLYYLPRLATRPEHIKALRQTILNLAVCGRLVHQDRTEGTAPELLKLIDLENQFLKKMKGISAQQLGVLTEGTELDADIPCTWRRANLQDLSYQITDGTHLTPKYTEQGKPFLSAQNVKPFRFIPQKHRFVSLVDFDNYRANRKPERGDVLLTRVGAGIGEAAVLDSDLEFAFYVSLCLIKIPTKYLVPEYLVLWLNSPEGRECSTARTYGKGASQGNLNLGQIRTFEIPVPPLPEQHRIVAKVDVLIALCDQLEAQLTTTETDSCLLLEAVLDAALTPA